MIELPNLDDQRFSDIVEAAKRRIPVIFPEWTDFNEHDPGITMIELFAWLKEMQQYYLNRLSDSSYENMLRMLGVEIDRETPARAEVKFSDPPELVMKGARAVGGDGTVFISEESFRREAFRLGRIYLEAAGSFHDVTELMLDKDADVYPFGSVRNRDNRRLYIGFEVIDERFFKDGAKLVFAVADKCSVARNPAYEGCRRPRETVWEYSTAKGFRPCTAVADKTLDLSFSGEIRLHTERDLAAFGGEGKLPAGTYFRVSLAAFGCEDTPALRGIYTDNLYLTQMRRGSDYVDLLYDGAPMVVSDELAISGLSYVLVRDTDGWRYAEEATVVSHHDGCVVDIAECPIIPAMDGAPNVRVIFAEEPFGRSKMFHSSNGLPNQSFSIEADEDVLTESLRIMAAQTSPRGETLWLDYSFVDSLALAGPYDRAFTYDRDRRMIVFGDNENGEVPGRGDDSIMVISCAYTRGSRGNLRRGNLSVLNSVAGEYGIEQVEDATGGGDRETLYQAMDRLKLSLNQCTKAVSAEDYRTLALTTPAVRIADAKAIPCFDPDLPNASAEKLANTVTLAVLPYSGDEYPLPDESFLAAVRDHLENYRMITTYLKVTAPIYVQVNISAEVKSSIRDTAPICRRAEEAVRALYSSFSTGGAKFGEPITESSIITEINRVEGVLTVDRVQIHIDDSRCYRDRHGRIVIPPHAIARPGRIHITVLEP